MRPQKPAECPVRRPRLDAKKPQPSRSSSAMLQRTINVGTFDPARIATPVLVVTPFFGAGQGGSPGASQWLAESRNVFPPENEQPLVSQGFGRVPSSFQRSGRDSLTAAQVP